MMAETDRQVALKAQMGNNTPDSVTFRMEMSQLHDRGVLVFCQSLGTCKKGLFTPSQIENLSPPCSLSARTATVTLHLYL